MRNWFRLIWFRNNSSRRSLKRRSSSIVSLHWSLLNNRSRLLLCFYFFFKIFGCHRRKVFFPRHYIRKKIISWFYNFFFSFCSNYFLDYCFFCYHSIIIFIINDFNFFGIKSKSRKKSTTTKFCGFEHIILIFFFVLCRIFFRRNFDFRFLFLFVIGNWYGFFWHSIQKNIIKSI